MSGFATLDSDAKNTHDKLICFIGLLVYLSLMPEDEEIELTDNVFKWYVGFLKSLHGE